MPKLARWTGTRTGLLRLLTLAVLGLENGQVRRSLELTSKVLKLKSLIAKEHRDVRSSLLQSRCARIQLGTDTHLPLCAIGGNLSLDRICIPFLVPKHTIILIAVPLPILIAVPLPIPMPVVTAVPCWVLRRPLHDRAYQEVLAKSGQTRKLLGSNRGAQGPAIIR